VARLTGLKPDTLRVWERRYGLGASQKSGNGRRLYTQTDLEHLQIISSLLSSGLRIGDIASMESKTLTALAARQEIPDTDSPGELRPRVVFAGVTLCSWLRRHPACLSHLDVLTLAVSPDELLRGEEKQLESVDILVLEYTKLEAGQLEIIEQIRQRAGAVPTAVLYETGSAHSLRALSNLGIVGASLPLDTSVYAAMMKQLRAALDTAWGQGHIGKLAAAQARLFSDTELATLVGDTANETDGLACGCKKHLSGLIRMLAEFEDYSRDCGAENWEAATTHACIYTYTNRARWLMEKALSVALEDEAPGGQP
jgi:DNA-binding transcriptional MerR regulator